MADRRAEDVYGAQTGASTETGDRFKLHELAELLDAPIEKVRNWLTDEGIEPVSPDLPEDYGVDAMEYVRARQHQF